jgi:hypothetical protein
MDDIQKLQNHITALEQELDAIWREIFGMKPPARRDSGGAGVVASRDPYGRRIYDRGAQ